MKILKSLSCLCLIWGLLVFMTGCPQSAVKTEPYGKAYFTYFDTVSYIYNYAGDSTDKFDSICEDVTAILEEYHNQNYSISFPQFLFVFVVLCNRLFRHRVKNDSLFFPSVLCIHKILHPF